jgi:integral membrane protein (TIGR01906 family)
VVHRLVIVLSAVIVVATPAVLIGNAAWLLMQPWFIDAQYALPGFPHDPHGVQDPERTALAKVGVRSIQPGDEGVELLVQARLADGRPAFGAREIQHMSDVRGLVRGLLVAWGAALTCVLAAALLLWRLGSIGAVREALGRGGRLTVALMVTLGLAMALGFDRMFRALHSLTFDGESWRFADEYTVRQLFPDAFWIVAGVALTALVLAQASTILAVLRDRRPVHTAKRIVS